MLGECSKSCGGGTLTQTRQVKVESQHGGEECTGADTLEVSCNVDECPGNKKLVESMMANFKSIVIYYTYSLRILHKTQLIYCIYSHKFSTFVKFPASKWICWRLE